MKYSVIIPSKNPINCVACVRSLFANEPDLPGERIIVVDDGARKEAQPEICSRFRKGSRGEQIAVTDFADIVNGPRITWLDGRKPFAFARNVNIGIRHAFDEQHADGVFLMNDDSTLITVGGFSRLAAAVAGTGFGVVSAAITAGVGNPLQKPQGALGIRCVDRVIAFICVYLPRSTSERIGLLDESFDKGYGWEDNDYCKRVERASLRLGVFDGCHVEHDRLESTFRSGNKRVSIINGNAREYYRKWGDLQGVQIPPEWEHAACSG